MVLQKNQFISYRRCSTRSQGQSGLGLDAQKKSIDDYLTAVDGELIKDVVEVASGKDDSNRPQLQNAIQLARTSGATIVVSKLCRLSRDLEFIARLMKDSKVRFRISTMRDADEFSISIWACMVHKERQEISIRTKDALRAAKRRGVRLGIAGKENIKKCNVRKIQLADSFAIKMNNIIQPLRDSGHTLQGIADVLNASGVKTPRGCLYTPTAVRNCIKRMNVVQRSKVS